MMARIIAAIAVASVFIAYGAMMSILGYIAIFILMKLF